VLRDGHRDALNVGLLERVLAQHRCGDVAGESDHRHAVHVGCGNAGDEVRGTGAAGGQHDAGAARRAGGGGGGRPNMAQAGGKNPAGIPDAVAEAKTALETQIK